MRLGNTFTRLFSGFEQRVERFRIISNCGLALLLFKKKERNITLDSVRTAILVRRHRQSSPICNVLSGRLDPLRVSLQVQVCTLTLLVGIFRRDEYQISLSTGLL